MSELGPAVPAARLPCTTISLPYEENAIMRARRCGDRAKVRELHKQLRSLPVGNPHDPGFRRLHYARYADDTLLGFTGPKAEEGRELARWP
jgi:hypothetical protein